MYTWSSKPLFCLFLLIFAALACTNTPTIPTTTAGQPVSNGAGSEASAVLEPLFANVQLDGNNQATIGITQAELQTAIDVAQTQSNQTMIQNLTVSFVDGQIHLAGTITQPIAGNVLVIFRPYVANNNLQFEVVSADVAGVRLPNALLASATSAVNSTLGQAATQLPPNIILVDVTVLTGSLQVVVQKTN
ncbi:MAG TPA: hypothetical protein VLL52_01315 [Anaerolineae bacterium]|nr:hypothetical protein [Anaerolineae bacterium]